MAKDPYTSDNPLVDCELLGGVIGELLPARNGLNVRS